MSDLLLQYADQLSKRENLDHAMACSAADALISEEVEAASKKAFLLALAEKGETATEVAALASVFRKLSKEVDFGELPTKGIDVCGTGGDGAGMFNVSTVVSMILAAAGIPMFKHGNRSITSKCGSADLLEALGFNLEADEALQQKSMKQLNFVFFFAPAYHPAFKAIMPVRKELAAEGKRTVFNILGPLINPAQPATQMLGVFHPSWVNALAETLGQLGLRRGLVVSSQISDAQFADELTCAGENHVAAFGNLSLDKASWKPEDFGLSACALSDLAGGGRDENLDLLNQLMKGEAPQGLEDTVVWNAGTALWIAEKVENVKDGISLARSILKDGRLSDWLSLAKGVYS